MFLQNEFTKQYIELIESARNNPPQDEYTEKHHIIPRSLGGPDNPDNIVVLSLRDHLLAHKLLVDMTEGVNRGKMAYAYKFMINCDNFEILPEEYERIKILSIEYRKSLWKNEEFRMNASQHMSDSWNEHRKQNQSEKMKK